jgi:tetratricopeptide (TPR) repeat protein
MKIHRLLAPVLIICGLFSNVVSGASLIKAEMLSDHGLVAEAKLELIEIIHTRSADVDKASAYYQLGGIAFDENSISVALQSWTTLVDQYPSSPEAALVKEKISALSEVVGESAKQSVNNAVASSYLRHADFWSKSKSNMFTIDSSWIPKVEAAIKWYDKVIDEFPNSVASDVAYQDKLRTILGWKDAGQYGSKHGIKKNFVNYMPQLLATFDEWVTEHPDSSTIQAFRYQIAQVYWDQKDWDNTRLWLNKIISTAGEGDSFYKDTAIRRLAKVEY